MELLNDKFSIPIIVIMPDNSEEFTPFQGFNIKLLESSAAQYLNIIALIPWSLREIFQNRNDIIKSRYTIGYRETYLLSKKNLEKNIDFLNRPFAFIVYDPDDHGFVQKTSTLFKFKPITISENDNADIKVSEIKTSYAFDQILLERYKDFIISFDISNKKTINGLSKLKLRDNNSNTLEFPSRAHNVTKTNELILLSLGYNFDGENKIRGSSGGRVYINAILESARHLIDKINEHDFDNHEELVVYATGMYSYLYDMNDEQWFFLKEETSQKEYSFIVNGILKNPNYSGFSATITENPYNNKTLSPILKIRQIESLLTTLSIFLLAESKICPAIRLPNSVHFYSNKLKEIEILSSSESENDNLLRNKKFRALHSILKKGIGKNICDFINENSRQITFASDFPLEWIRFNKIPVMFSHKTSRINISPGNMLLVNSSSNHKVSLKMDELNEILIIRSFDPADHRKFYLERALDICLEKSPSTKCIIEDVSSFQEMVKILNEFKGNILIMDCHGHHGGNKDHGWLIIGEDRVDTWQLNEVARVPPIVILSACSTSALSGSHASVTNGFLVSGAISVIGTLLPVHAVKSAAFVGRLVYRIAEFLPIIKKLGYMTTSWRVFVSTFMCMSYVTDILKHLNDKGIIDESEYNSIHLKTSVNINILNDDWYEEMITDLINTGKINKSALDKILTDELFLTETMHYSQIGRPENIMIDLTN